MDNTHDRRLLRCLEYTVVDTAETGLQKNEQNNHDSDKLMGAIVMLGLEQRQHAY